MAFEKIDGAVVNLRVSSGCMAYARLSSEINVLGAAEVAAAALGEIFSSTILSDGAAGTEVSMQYFSCSINDKQVVGKFHEVGFNNGECVEFIVSHENDLVIAHAARSEAQRLLWMLPYSARGHAAQKRSDIKWSLIFAIVGALVMAVLEHLMIRPHPNKTTYYFVLMYGCAFAITLTVSIWTRSRFFRFAETATEVLSTFGFPNPQDVDLDVIHKNAAKRLHHETNIHPPVTGPWCYRY